MFPLKKSGSQHGPPKHGSPKGGHGKPSPGGPKPKGGGNPFPPSGGATSQGKAKTVKPGSTDPILGLKNALKAEQVGALAMQVAKGGGF